MANEDRSTTGQATTRPAARLGYAAADVEAFLLAGEHRITELEAEIAIAEQRRDDAIRRAEESPKLRLRVAQEWLDAWGEANGSSAAADKERA